MEKTYEFLKQVLDSITEHIVVIDKEGEILYTNKAWDKFGQNNDCIIRDGWIGVNYAQECQKAVQLEDEFAICASGGIKEVIEGKKPLYYFEYPCHSLTEKRWFMMRITSFKIGETDCYVISHQNITERKLAEEKVQNLARIDGLTEVANRRTFEEFLNSEWRRCARLQVPLSLAIIDLDHFKLLNDTYGHQAGDKCLIKVGRLLREFATRPGDLCARYGGEEFAIIWGGTNLKQSKHLADKLQKRIAELNIQNRKAPTKNYLTASIGIATMIPRQGSEEKELIAKADNSLYKAKVNGRNRVYAE